MNGRKTLAVVLHKGCLLVLVLIGYRHVPFTFDLLLLNVNFCRMTISQYSRETSQTSRWNYTRKLFRHRSIIINQRVRLAFLLQPENLAARRRHQSALWHFVVLFKVICHLFHCHPLDTLVFVDVLNDPTQSASVYSLHGMLLELVAQRTSRA
jgi:hypothetical protein